MKKWTAIVMAVLTATRTYSVGESRTCIRVAADIKSWQAEALAKMRSGYLIAGQEWSSGLSGRILVTALDPICRKGWTSSLGLGKAGGIEVMDARHALVSGSEDGIAKLWKVSTALRGRIAWQVPLGMGLARSVKKSSGDQVFVTIEHGIDLKIKRLDHAGKMIWEKKLPNKRKAKSSLLVSREGYVVVACGGQGFALDSCGNIFWKHGSETTHWNGLFQRKNGEIIFYGHQKMKLFGPRNDEAFLMAVRPLDARCEWFRSFGKDANFDSGCAIAERPNGTLLLLARQDNRMRLIALREDYTIDRVKWLPAISTGEPVCTSRLMRTRSDEERWVTLDNRADGSVWLQSLQTRIRDSTDD